MEKQDNEMGEKNAANVPQNGPQVPAVNFTPNAPVLNQQIPPVVNQQLPPYMGPNMNMNPYQYPMPTSQPPPNCPPGLEYLTALNQVLVHQTVELLEVFTDFESSNRYVIKNSVGQRIYFAKEESNCCSRNCCGPKRSFQMGIVDYTGREVIHLERPFACQACCFPCCLQKMEVFSPPGILVGTVKQNWNCLFPSFSLKNVSGETMLRIKGPCCTSNCCFSDIEFDVISTNGNVKVGKISKQWSGLVKEAFTDADNFGISFPIDLDVRMKAVVLGACFLIDMMYFESKNNHTAEITTPNNVPGVQPNKCWCCCPGGSGVNCFCCC